jgi:mono/diheme cytochrome c family protein
MIDRSTIRYLAFSLVLGSGACDALPGRPRPYARVPPPDEVLDFASLYGTNCTGCHGPGGKNGPSIPLGDPVYLAIADDAFIRSITAKGMPGTPMPAFAKSAGGMLTERQVDVIARGIRVWAQWDALHGVSAPRHVASAPGRPQDGARVYAKYCAGCHGPDGQGGDHASSIVDGSYLALVSDQNLRTNVIVGRPEIGFPDFRNDVPGRPMSDPEVTDVVAWLSAQRARFPGQPYPKAGPEVTKGELP